MTRWYTSDLHFSHKNIVKFTERGVDTTQEYHNEWLAAVWNSQVNEGDEVYHLGDFCFAKKYEDVANIVSRLKGQKHFLKGNHDDRKVLDQLKKDSLIVNWHEYKEVHLGKIPVVLFHFPVGSWHKQGYGAFHLHGHCHSNYREGKGKILDVGLDSAYEVLGKHCLFSEQDVLQYMQTRKLYLSDHHKDHNSNENPITN